MNDPKPYEKELKDNKYLITFDLKYLDQSSSG